MSDYPTTSPTTDSSPLRLNNRRLNNFFLYRKRLGYALSRMCHWIWRNLCAAIVSIPRSLPSLFRVVGSLVSRGRGLILKTFRYVLVLNDQAVINLDDALEWIVNLTLPAFEAALTWIKTSPKVLSSRSIEHLRKGIDITQVWLSTWTKPIVRADDNTLTYKILATAAMCVIAIGMFLTCTYGFRAYWRLRDNFWDSSSRVGRGKGLWLRRVVEGGVCSVVAALVALGCLGRWGGEESWMEVLEERRDRLLMLRWEYVGGWLRTWL